MLRNMSNPHGVNFEARHFPTYFLIIAKALSSVAMVGGDVSKPEEYSDARQSLLRELLLPALLVANYVVHQMPCTLRLEVQ